MASFGGFGAAGGGAPSFGAPTGFGAAPATPSPFGAAPATSAFGNPSTPGFGAPKPATGGFGGFGQPAQAPAAGGFGGFGQPAQQPQPATSSAFGGGAFGAQPASTGFGGGGTTAFGATGATGGFGGASSPFGAPKPAAASPFGATSVFGGGATTGGFGAQPAATSGGFGTPAPASTFGGFGSVGKTPFGAAPAATSAFGQPQATTGGFGGFGQPAQVQQQPGQVQVGTGAPPYQPTREVEPSGVGTANYVSISRMPAYAHKSTEELRFEDYLKRTNPAAAQAAATQNAPQATAAATGAGAFGQPAGGFGAPATSTGGFGGGAFGAAAPSAFGAPATSTGGFGGAAGGFGSPTTTSTGFGGFGGAATSTGLSFGKPAGTGAFGAAPAATGAFGAPATTSAFGATTGGFGAPATSTAGGFGASGFGATTAPATGGFGGFGATTGAAPGATGGFGASSFGKPAATSGFGGFGATTAPATGGFGGFGATTAQPAASGSLFGGAATTTATSAPFSFGGAAAPKPATTSGFSFGGAAGGGFGAAPAATGAFGATTGTGAFGAAASQPLGTTSSLFGGSSTGVGGGFGFGATASPTLGASTGAFGAPKPATGSMFGAATTTPAAGGSLFGGTTGGSSLFGGASSPAAGTGFGTSSFGATGTSSFGGFGSTPTGTTPSFGFGGTSSFGQAAQQQPQAAGAAGAAAQPNLVAAPDVNPYGAGSFGAGLVEQSVKAALDQQSLKAAGAGSSAARLNSFAHDVGLPRGPMDAPLVTRRQSVTSRHAIPVSFVRGSFKGSKGRFASFASSALTASARTGEIGGAGSAPEDEFKFSSSLFRTAGAKKLVIDKGDSNHSGGTSGRASVVPFTDEERADTHEIGSTRGRTLQVDEDGKFAVTFRNMTNRKTFTLRLVPTQSIKQARAEVKQLLRTSGSTTKAVQDIELVWKGRIVEDALVLEDLRIKEGESFDIVVIEDNAAEETKKADGKKNLETQSAAEAVPPKRFMTYDEFLASAIRDSSDDEPEVTRNGGRGLSTTVSSACPVLKNPDYYTVPAFSELQQMTEGELAQVEGFTVGCHGLGSVQWIGKTDVRHLNLDDLIFFERKEVIVYKDDDHNKHPQGSGLNRPAIVELLGIFPPRKSPTSDKYRDRVKQRTEDIGATFLDYTGDKGIWRFRVEHFSRYGFDDDEDDDDVDMDAANATGSGLQTSGHKMVSSSRELRSSSVTHRSTLLRKSTMFNSGVGVDTVAAFSGAGASRAGGSWTTTAPTAVDPVEEEPVALAIDDDSTSKKVSLPASSAFVLPPIVLKPLGLGAEGARLPISDKSATYQLMQQSSGQGSAAVHNHVDAGMFMARSFRCSWGPNGELVTLGRPISRSVASDSSQRREGLAATVNIEFPLRSAATVARKAEIQEALKMHFECASQRQRSVSEDEEEQSDAPKAFALPSDMMLVNSLHRYVAFAESKASAAGHATELTRKKLLLWKLVRALWGQEHSVRDMDNNALLPLAARDDPSALENLDTFQWLDLRRQFASQWFEEAVESHVDLTATPENVLQLLLQHRVAEAAELAMACGDFRLATLVAQADTMAGGDFRSLLEAQMAQWSDDGTLELMDEPLILVYSLLAGSVEVVTARQQLATARPWLESLALFLWYKRGPATSLRAALEEFQEAVAKRQAPAPLSAFDSAGDKDDVLMELMKLYVGSSGSLSAVLSPSGWTGNAAGSRHHLDYELVWHLHSVLRAAGYRLERQWESHVHRGFMDQLERAGLWEEAVYVALNASDAAERAATARALLFRNADLLAQKPAARREALAARLGLPIEWLSEALAVRAVARHAPHDEIAHWMAAGKFAAAHAALMARVALPCVFAGEAAVAAQLLQELEPHAAAIPQWRSATQAHALGGGLLLEYLRLERHDGLQAGGERDFLARVQVLADQLSTVKSDDSQDSERRVARAVVASMLVALASQAVQVQTALAVAKERELEDESEAAGGDGGAEPPLELSPEFLGGLTRVTGGRESAFVETFRSQQLLGLCSAYLDWRA